MSALHEKTMHEVGGLLKKREIKSRDLVESLLERIELTDGQIGAYLHVAAESALEQADQSDQQRAVGGKEGPLMGIPIAPKDIFLTRGMPTTCGSKILEGFVPAFNATVIDKCLSAGAVMLGKLNMDEFAMGSSNETSAYKICRNPWDGACVPGGSSGGSAASVAAGTSFASLGTDTGGSIRQPAAFCGVVGLKPTYGRVSRYGVIAFASSLDQVGPITKDVQDCALMMNVISGYDPRDSTALNHAVPDYTQSLNKSIKGKRLGVPKEYFGEGLEGEIRAAVMGAVRVLEGLGASIEEISLPNTEYAGSVYYVLAPAEASSNLARYDGVRYGLRVTADDLIAMYERTRTRGFGLEVKRRIMLGTYVLSAGYYDAYYLSAQKARTVIREDFRRAFEKVDAIVAPTAPTAAFKLGEKTADPLKMYLNDVYTIPVNLAGLPGLSLPCGFTAYHLPIGLQLIGPPMAEATLLQIAHAYEQATEWHRRRPATVPP